LGRFSAGHECFLYRPSPPRLESFTKKTGPLRLVALAGSKLPCLWRFAILPWRVSLAARHGSAMCPGNGLVLASESHAVVSIAPDDMGVSSRTIRSVPIRAEFRICSLLYQLLIFDLDVGSKVMFLKPRYFRPLEAR
jgi:hypothetical protein